MKNSNSTHNANRKPLKVQGIGAIERSNNGEIRKLGKETIEKIEIEEYYSEIEGKIEKSKISK